MTEKDERMNEMFANAVAQQMAAQWRRGHCIDIAEMIRDAIEDYEHRCHDALGEDRDDCHICNPPFVPGAFYVPPERPRFGRRLVAKAR